jgi:hypothetical protein
VRHIDPLQIGRQDGLRWLAGAEAMIAADRRWPFATPVCHVHYRNLVHDPLGTVEQLYAHFGLKLAAEVADSVRRRVQDKPNGGYGVHRYRFEDHGLDPVEQRRRFAGYVEHFRITTEVD